MKDRVIAEIDGWVWQCTSEGVLRFRHSCNQGPWMYNVNPRVCWGCGKSLPKSLRGIIDLAHMAMK